MGYYIRYFVEGPKAPTLEDLSAAFAAAGSSAKLVDGLLIDGAYEAAVISIATPGDGLFEGEIEQFREYLSELRLSPAKRKVARCLDRAVAIVAAQILNDGRDDEATLSSVDPLWNWLDSHFAGLIQADGEGFYQGQKLILKLE